MSTLYDRSMALRTPGVACVLDAVRATGQSAHPVSPDVKVSALVSIVATIHGFNAEALQAEVNAYSDSLDW